MNIEFITTDDGSSSLYNKNLDETYHSTRGAITESDYVYIHQGLNLFINRGQKKISVLEVGFGTGLNVLLTAINAEKFELYINFTTLEVDPIPDSVIEKLNYGEILSTHLLNDIHSAIWNKKVTISEYFQLCKLKTSIESFVPNENYDLIYFDAFAPSKQPDVWDVKNLHKLKNCLNPEGILVTYCAQGNFRRNLDSIGFKVERLPGPPGKFEMIRAVNNINR